MCSVEKYSHLGKKGEIWFFFTHKNLSALLCAWPTKNMCVCVFWTLAIEVQHKVFMKGKLIKKDHKLSFAWLKTEHMSHHTSWWSADSSRRPVGFTTFCSVVHLSSAFLSSMWFLPESCSSYILLLCAFCFLSLNSSDKDQDRHTVNILESINFFCDGCLQKLKKVHYPKPYPTFFIYHWRWQEETLTERGIQVKMLESKVSCSCLFALRKSTFTLYFLPGHPKGCLS